MTNILFNTDKFVKNKIITEEVEQKVQEEQKIFDTIKTNKELLSIVKDDEVIVESVIKKLQKQKDLTKEEIIDIINNPITEPTEKEIDHDFFVMLKRDFSKEITSSTHYTIWRCYHDEKLIQKYNLREDNIVKIFNTCNLGYSGHNLNILTRFLSEGCCLLYPYLNNLKTDYIGFMHYRRLFNYDMNYLPLKLLAQDNIQYFHFHMPTDEIKKYREEYGCIGFDYRTPYKNIENHCFFWSTDKCGIMDDLIEFLETQYPQYLENEKEIHDIVWACIFVCRWDIYKELAKFLYDYISFISDKYQLNWDEKKWYKHVYDKFLIYNQEHHPKTPDNVFCKRVEDDGSVWCELPFWGDKGWTTCPYSGYKTSINTHSNLFRVYSYNIEFLTSVFIYNHKHFIDMNNVLYFINEDGTKTKIPFQNSSEY